MDQFKGKQAVVVGLGKSGAAVAAFLHARGARLTLTDSSIQIQPNPVLLALQKQGARLELGSHQLETFIRADLIVLSPGVSHQIEPVQAAMQKGIPVWGEIELASRFIEQPIIAITGTNGKTTTTRLIGEMLSRSGLKPFVGGNIGTPLLDYVMQPEKADVVVAEISSFQLDTIQRFRPHVAVLLNITADHLDRYDGMAGYAASKARIFENQGPADVAVLNGADEYIQAAAGNIKARKLFFNPPAGAKEKAVINRESISLETGPGRTELVDLRGIPLMGRHNHENIAAAALAVLAAGGTIQGIQAALNAFKGLPHRLELVSREGGVDYYDDSKATNVDAVVRAVASFPGRLIIIMGGRDKGGDYDPLADLLREKAKMLILIGEAADKIHKALSPIVAVQRADSMEAAVALAKAAATPGDTVLLSPACSSFDMFESYAHRGAVFQQAVIGKKEKAE